MLTLAPQRASNTDTRTADTAQPTCGTCNDAGFLKPASKVDGNVITLEETLCPQLMLELEADRIEALDDAYAERIENDWFGIENDLAA